ncbi:MAG: hypothetical protein HQL31_09685 [Planctomycetes bacterium]|nr:hypothetical protein [Planctomycetota bacterium]
MLTGSDIHYKSYIAGGVTFPHGRGIVIGEGVRIEKRCSVFHNTTLGGLEGSAGFPFLEEGVNVYPGSVIAGDIRIGEYSRIGPNVFLRQSVPPRTRVSPPKPDIHAELDRHQNHSPTGD